MIPDIHHHSIGSLPPRERPGRLTTDQQLAAVRLCHDIPVEIWSVIAGYLERSDLRALRLTCRKVEYKLGSIFFRDVAVPFRAELYPIIITTDTSNDLTNAGITNADFANAGFTNTGFIDADFTNAHLTKTDYKNTNFPGPQLSTVDTADIASIAAQLAKGPNNHHLDHRHDHHVPNLQLPRQRVQLKAPTEELLHDGMRMFRSFGKHIKRFTLSFRLPEATLAFPPPKPLHKLVTSFWGLFLWPENRYLRYRELERLEQTADETQSMKHALSTLTSVCELGLDSDAGMGYLLGPDAPPTEPPAAVSPIGNLSKQQQHGIDRLGDALVMDGSDSRRPTQKCLDIYKQAAIEKMLKDAGYHYDLLEDVIHLIFRTEGDDCPPSPSGGCPGPLRREDDSDSDLDTGPLAAPVTQTSPPFDIHTAPLHPTSLTRYQQELLLELEWAHRALIQSYVLSVTSCMAIDAFRHLRSIRLSRVPSSHLAIFNDADFWRALHSVDSVTLGVIPDWRQILLQRHAPGHISDVRKSPLEAVSIVYNLLKTHISRKRSIKNLHFEWLCGGELAPGLTQRGQLILPAPFVSQSSLMVDPHAATRPGLLSLPYIHTLSLKNCFFSPHVFLQTIRLMSLVALEHLELESVSITGPPTTVKQQVWPWFLGHCNAQPCKDPPDPVHTGVAGPQQQAQPQAHHHLNAVGNAPGGPWMAVAGAGFQWNAGVIPNPAAGGPGFMNGLQQGIAAAGGGTLTLIWDPLPAGDTAPGLILNPPVFTWAGILEELTPETTARDFQAYLTGADPPDDSAMLAQGAFIPNAKRWPIDRQAFNLSTLVFKSCGYVAVNGDFIATYELLPDECDAGAESMAAQSRRINLLQYMLGSPADRKNTGTIIRNMLPQERSILCLVHGLEFGWQHVYDRETRQAAVGDGVVGAGDWRFSGTIKKRTDGGKHSQHPTTRRMCGTWI